MMRSASVDGGVRCEYVFTVQAVFEEMKTRSNKVEKGGRKKDRFLGVSGVSSFFVC